MKKATLLLLALSIVISLCSCGAKEADTPNEDTTPSVTEEVSTEPATAETEATTSAPKDYVHGEDGYFNLLEEYPDIRMKEQEGGTCWLFSAANSMETAYVMKNGSYITVDPMEMLDRIYLDEKEEGFFPKEGFNGKNIGGWQWMVTETLTNGFGDITIDGSVILDTDDRDAIKEAVKNRGGVAIGVNDTDNRYKGWHGGYYTLIIRERNSTTMLL